MRHLTYVGVLLFCLVGSLWLEYVLRTRVFRRWLRLLLTLIPIALLFSIWDLYAIAQGHWSFDADQTTGLTLGGGLPLDELLFFLVVPVASVLAFEAVRSARGWPAGDEVADPERVVAGAEIADESGTSTS